MFKTHETKTERIVQSISASNQHFTLPQSCILSLSQKSHEKHLHK